MLRKHVGIILIVYMLTCNKMVSARNKQSHLIHAMSVFGYLVTQYCWRKAIVCGAVLDFFVSTIASASLYVITLALQHWQLSLIGNLGCLWSL